MFGKNINHRIRRRETESHPLLFQATSASRSNPNPIFTSTLSSECTFRNWKNVDDDHTHVTDMTDAIASTVQSFIRVIKQSTIVLINQF